MRSGALGNGCRDKTSSKIADPGIPPLPPRVALSRASCATSNAHRPASPAGAMASSAPSHSSASQLTFGVQQSLHAGAGSSFSQQCHEVRRPVAYGRSGVFAEPSGSAHVGRGPSPPPPPSPFVAMVQAMSAAKAALESSGGGAAAVRVKTGGGGLSAGIPRELRGRDGGETASGPELHWAGQM